MNDFSALGPIYDHFNENAHYDDYAQWICQQFKKRSHHKKSYQPRVVDIGCGTGEMSLRLASRGFDVIGVDLSATMLNIAMDKAIPHPNLNLMYVRQDMQKLSMDAKANLIISCYDTLNYLPDEESLFQTVQRISDHLCSGGVFIFDMNTLWRCETYYGNNTFVFKHNGEVLVWENQFDAQSGLLKFDVEVFTKQLPGLLYKRSREKLQQRYFSPKTVMLALKYAGFRNPEQTGENAYLDPRVPIEHKHIFIVEKP